MRFRDVSLLTGLLLCNACPTSPSRDATAPDAPAPSGMTPIVQIGALRLELSASATLLRSGTPDTLRMRLTNGSLVATVLHFPSGCQILPYVQDARKSVVAPEGGWLCTQALTQLVLAPGQSVVREVVWSGGAGFNLLPSADRALPTGIYYVLAEMAADEGTLRTAPLAIMLTSGGP